MGGVIVMVVIMIIVVMPVVIVLAMLSAVVMVFLECLAAGYTGNLGGHAGQFASELLHADLDRPDAVFFQ